MKNNVVLTDEVDKTRIITFPIIFPVFPVFVGPYFCVGDVSDRSVEPYIEHFSIGTSHRHRYSPIEVSGHGATL